MYEWSRRKVIRPESPGKGIALSCKQKGGGGNQFAAEEKRAYTFHRGYFKERN